MYALGTVIKTPPEGSGRSEIASRLLDYYDHWESVDPRLSEHSAALSPCSEAFGHDLVNMATYSTEILRWLRPENIRAPESVVVVGGMTEAFLLSLRAASDVVATAL